MALYTVSSSGNLKIADTGVGLPVSIFYGDGSAIASAPLGGGLSVSYVFNGNYNRISSTGNLKLYSGGYDLEGLLAGSTLGEQALGGGLASNQQTTVGLYFISGVINSVGNLTLTGSSTAIEAHQVQSSGNLSLTTSDSQTSTRLVVSSGQLRVTGTTVAPSIRQFTSSGNLNLSGSVVTRSIRIESTSGQLLFSGYGGMSTNQYSSGDLVVTSSVSGNILLQPTSTGLIKVATEWYTVNRIGGLSTEALASAPIAAGTDSVRSVLHTTLIGSYGITGKTSSGTLIVTPIGTAASDLGQDGSLAGSALASNSITEHRFNPDRTQFRQLQNINSAGALKFDASVKYRVDSVGAQLVITGRFGSNNDRTSSGNLVTTGNHSIESLRLALSSGNIVLSPLGENPLELNNSSIAGSALASVPIAGTVDSMTRSTTFRSLRNEDSSGQLVLNGSTGVGLKRLSSGNLSLTGSVVTRSLRNESTSGQLHLSGSVVTRSIRTIISNGSLILAEADAYRIRWDEGSSGQLVLTGSVVTSSLRTELTSGQLRLTGTDTTETIPATTSSGNIVFATVSQNPLTVDNGGLAGSPLATITIAGETDLPGYATLFRSLRTVVTSGTLVTSGSHTNSSTRLEISNTGQLRLSGSVVTSSLRNESTSGQLRLTGSDYNTSRRNEISTGQLALNGSVVTRSLRTAPTTGQLRLSGSVVTSSLRTELTSGQLQLTGSDYVTSNRNALSSGQLAIRPTGENPLASDSGIAGSSLASLPLAGGVDLITGKTTFSSLRTELTSGQLTLSGSVVTRSLRIELSSGQIRLTGSTVWNRAHGRSSSGNLRTTGSTVRSITNVNITSGNLKILNTGNNSALSSSGAIAGSAIADHPIVSNYEQPILSTKLTFILNGVFYRDTGLTTTSSGNLVLSGQSSNSSSKQETTDGQLVLTGTHDKNVLYRRSSDGNLVLSKADTTELTIIVNSAGYLTVAASDTTETTSIVSSSGNLILANFTFGNKVVFDATDPDVVDIVTNTFTISTGHGFVTGDRLLYRDPGAIGGLADSSVYYAIALDAYSFQLSYSEYGALNGTDIVDITSLGLGTTDSFTVLVNSTGQVSTRTVDSAGNLIVNGTTIVGGSSQYTITSSGNLRVTGAHSKNVIHGVSSSGNITTSGTHVKSVTTARTSSGNLRVTGSHTLEITHSISSSGNLRTSGTHTKSITVAEASNGNLVVTGTHSRKFVHNVSSSGTVQINGTTAVSITQARTSSGNLRFTGTSQFVAIKKSSVTSSGNLLLSGTSEVGLRRPLTEIASSGNIVLTGISDSRFVPRPKVQERGNAGGGGYVYATSWDILKPYFPDDRHILGYRDAKSSGDGLLKVSGSTRVSLVKAIPAPKKPNLLASYIKQVEAAKAKKLQDSLEKVEAKKEIEPVVAKNKILEQIRLEDEMLINGSLLDPIQDELDRELML